MTYDSNYRNHFYNRQVQNARPMGINNLNQLVETQLGHGGFEVVRTIYDNIQWLYALFNNIQTVTSVGNKLYAIENLYKYLGDIESIGSNINMLVDLNNDLPVIRELAPRIKSFVTELQEVNQGILDNKATMEAIQSNMVKLREETASILTLAETRISEVVEQAERKLECMLDSWKKELGNTVESVVDARNDIMSFIPVFNKVVDHQNQINQVITHLLASDAVTIALSTNEQADYDFADDRIRDSERLGTNETLLRERLGFRTTDNSVATILVENKAIYDTKRDEVLSKHPQLKLEFNVLNRSELHNCDGDTNTEEDCPEEDQTQDNLCGGCNG